MPGILPMKVIKIGSSSQSRVAQACDRCRSKKIRCDGIRPCCTQCANVGFECKTSDKLSRRAFPRGYTESLEERVRSLETEVHELKDLLDEKDEKIDILSRIHAHPFSPSQDRNHMPPPQQPSQRSSNASSTQGTSLSPQNSSPPSGSVSAQGRASTFVSHGDAAEPHALGPSTDAFKAKAQEKGKLPRPVKSEAFFSNARPSVHRSSVDSLSDTGPPPRLASDQLVNIFFQEWAPLFPIVHSPSFLQNYEQYMTAPDSVDDQHFLTQLFLILGIASISGGARNQHDTASFEARWRASLDPIKDESSLPTLQCLALAQMYCIAKGDYGRLVSYRSLSTGMALYFGLQQSQKGLSMDALSIETRKRVFWTLYTLDCFTAALLGLPKMFRESEIQVEYPVEIDDENVSKQGFHHSNSDESTKISSALAMFKASRILSNVLDKLYPAGGTGSEVPSRDVRALSEDLENWSSSLPSHLKLEFVQDKPATNIISSRCPIMSLTFYYIRSLIHRAILVSSTGHQAASSTLALAESSKRIIQIVQLLEERGLSFSICLNKTDVLVLAGFGLLYRNLETTRDGKLVKDSQSLLASVADILDRSGAPCASDFRLVANPVRPHPKLENIKSRSFSDGNIAPNQAKARPPPNRLQALAARLARTGDKHGQKQDDKAGRRATIPNIHVPEAHNHSNVRSRQPSSTGLSAGLESMGFRSDSVDSRGHNDPRSPMQTKSLINLDYLPLDVVKSNDDFQDHSGSMKNESVTPEEWERILGNIDNGPTNIYDNIYGGRPVSALAEMGSMPHNNDVVDWSSPGMWSNASGAPLAPVQSALSFSEESLTSGGEELSSGELSTRQPATGPMPYAGLTLPEDLTGDAFGLDLLNGSLNAI